MSFNEIQQVALAVTPKITAALSILGSSWIVVEVLTQREKRGNVYNRLLCAMSFFDVINSSWFFASTWPIPEGTEGVAWAVGNEKTCVVQGFFLQAGMIPPMYNSCLAIYYLLVVKYGFTEERLRFAIEPAMHLFTIAYGLSTGTAGLILDLYNNANLWCWIAPYPPGCQDSGAYGETPCTRGVNASIYIWAFYFVPLWFCISFITIIMVSIYRAVRKRELDAIAADAQLADIDGDAGNQVLSSVVQDSTTSFSLLQTTRVQMARKSSIVLPKSMVQMFQPSGSFKASSGAEQADANYVLETIETFKSANNQNLEANSFGSRAVFQQAMYYTLAVYATFTFATLNRALQQVTSTTFFGVIYLHSFFIPLQGFFNVLIYRHAYFFRLKQRNPHMSGSELFRYTWRWSFLGPPPDTKERGQIGRASRNGTGKSAFVTSATADKPDLKSANLEPNPDLRAAQVADDALDPIGGDFSSDLTADVLMSYAEFPNMLTEDAVMVATQYPTMIGQDS